jgi:hypothetical protein
VSRRGGGLSRFRLPTRQQGQRSCCCFWQMCGCCCFCCCSCSCIGGSSGGRWVRGGRRAANADGGEGEAAPSCGAVPYGVVVAEQLDVGTPVVNFAHKGVLCRSSRPSPNVHRSSEH